MPPVTFLNPLLLFGLGALAIPILIHLLLRRQRQKLRFSTVQFFAPEERQSKQKRKLRNLLLLAARLLLLFTVVLAFARPYLPTTGASNVGSSGRWAVFVMDRSASLQTQEGQGTRWSDLKRQLLTALDALAPEDHAALISCSGTPSVVSSFAPPDVIRRKVAQLQPSYAATDLGRGIDKAGRMFALNSAARQARERMIYVLSDLQSGSCPDLGRHALPPGIDLQILSPPDNTTANLAVTALRATSGGAAVTAAIDNFSPERSGPTKLTLRLDDQNLLPRRIDLPAWGYTNLLLDLPALKPGWHGIEVGLDGGDSFPPDDQRALAYYVPTPIRVLCLEPRGSRPVYDQTTFFVRNALAPRGPDGQSPRSPFEVKIAAVSDLPEQLHSVNSGEPSRRFDLVVLPVLKSLSPAGIARLTEFVSAGGGAILFFGEETIPSEFNSQFAGLAPVELGQVEGSAQGENIAWSLREVDASFPGFAVFRQPGNGDLTLPQFTRRFQMFPDSGSRVAARFDDGAPAMVSKQLGRGTVFVVDTSADTAWTDWPKHKTFLPWLNNLGRWLAGRSAAGTAPETANLTAGAEADLDLGPAARLQKVRIVGPAGTETLVTADRQGYLHRLNLAQPGIYRIHLPGDPAVRVLAIQMDPRESDPARLTPAEFERQLSKRAAPLADQPISSRSFEGEGGAHNWWRLLLGTSLVLLIGEIWLANQT